MDITTPLPQPRWTTLLRDNIKAHPRIAIGLGMSLAVMCLLLLQSLFMIAAGNINQGARYALIGGAIGFGANALGALPTLFFRSIPQHIKDSILGFAAGMMLGASIFSLLLPGLKAAELFSGSELLALTIIVISMMLGVTLMLGLDKFIPHQHETAGAFGPGHERCPKIWLFVFAIALHNLPEGMALGVSFSQGDMSVGVPLTAAIALHNIAEGLAVALAISAVGFRPVVAVLLASLSGLLEPLGVLIGIGLSSGSFLAYPIGLGLAAGAMIFVVSHEVIPETHRNGHQTYATLSLMVGFAVMMVLDVALG